jgi:hypothetical protein
MKTCEKGLHQYSKDLLRCPECRKIAKKAYRDTHKVQQKELYKAWYEAHKEQQLAANKKYKGDNVERVKVLEKNWYEAHKEEVKARSSAWRKANPDKRNALYARYRAAKNEATPEWLTDKHLEEIQEFYTLAQELAWLNQDGKAFHVDHIIPLRGKDVCGLHVPWNLQLLTWQENLSKSNKVTS